MLLSVSSPSASCFPGRQSPIVELPLVFTSQYFAVPGLSSPAAFQVLLDPAADPTIPSPFRSHKQVHHALVGCLAHEQHLLEPPSAALVQPSRHLPSALLQAPGTAVYIQ
ncbi:hypothetical protein MN608_03970 [Microdochium nivale]|nr:hypothetical protein MN608_03970 [Microdochium nivale]